MWLKLAFGVDGRLERLLGYGLTLTLNLLVLFPAQYFAYKTVFLPVRFWFLGGMRLKRWYLSIGFKLLNTTWNVTINWSYWSFLVLGHRLLLYGYDWLACLCGPRVLGKNFDRLLTSVRNRPIFILEVYDDHFRLVSINFFHSNSFLIILYQLFMQILSAWSCLRSRLPTAITWHLDPWRMCCNLLLLCIC